MKVIVVTLVHGGEVTVCKVFTDGNRKQAIAFWEELNEGKGRRDEARISIEDVIPHDPPTGETTASGEGNEMNDDVPRVERPELLKAYNEGWELVKLRAAVSAYLEADEAYHNRDSRDTGVAYSAVVKARAELCQVLTTADAQQPPPGTAATTAASDSYPAPEDPAVEPVPLEDREGT